jgi:RNA polymerase sigma factor (sigma-70 family)
MSNDALLLDWRKLWNRSLHRFIGRRVGARVDIEDLAQETYLRVLRARDLDDVRNPKAYLLRVAANVVSEWRYLQPPVTLFEPVEDNFAPVLEVDAVVSQGELDEVLADLPVATRAVVLLRFRDNLSCRDIARNLQLSDRQVRRHLTRASAGVAICSLWAALHARGPSYETVLGEQRSVVLADGSIVTLNTSSAIDVRMEKDRRAIQLLSGEALFAVVHDAARPFDVVAGGTTVRAVGTQFDVDRRPGATTVTVVEGQVLVSGTGEDRLPLAAGQQVTLGTQAAHVPVRADTATAVAWTQRKLIFAHRQLGAVAAEFNRYNRQSIEIRSAELRGQEISGVFQANDPASFLMFLSRLPAVHIEKSRDGLRFIVTLDSPHGDLRQSQGTVTRDAS